VRSWPRRSAAPTTAPPCWPGSSGRCQRRTPRRFVACCGGGRRDRGRGGAGALAVLLAGPVPARLARAPGRPTPGGSTRGVAGDRSRRRPVAAGGLRGPSRLALDSLDRVATFGATLLWLVAVLITSTVRVVLARRRHRYLLDLLAERERAGSPCWPPGAGRVLGARSAIAHRPVAWHVRPACRGRTRRRHRP